MKEEALFKQTLKDDDFLPEPDFNKVWRGIQQNKAPKNRWKHKSLAAVSALILAVSIGSISYGEEILKLVTVDIGGGKTTTIENESPFDKNKEASESVESLMKGFEKSEAKDILGFQPVEPAYLPGGYRYNGEQGIKAVPNYNDEGELLSMDESVKSYIFYYVEDSQDHGYDFTVSYDVRTIKIDPNIYYGSIPRKNPESISIGNFKGVVHDNGISVFKKVAEDQELSIEVFSEKYNDRAELTKVMESIVEKLKLN